MMKKIKITTKQYEFYAELYDCETANLIFESLPIENTISTWGDEIYFSINVHCALETEAKSEVNIGELAYWPDMPAFCIFFGKTPISPGSNPVAAGPVNVFGKLEKIETDLLRKISYGTDIKIERA